MGQRRQRDTETMKIEFEKQLNELLGAQKERTLLMTDHRYNEIVAETKEANERRSKGLQLSGIHYRRLKRFDVIMTGNMEKLVQKTAKSRISKKLIFCMASDMFNVVHKSHLKIGHKKEKGMEQELKKKYCNITREVIAIYLSLCKDCCSRRRVRTKESGGEPKLGVSQGKPIPAAFKLRNGDAGSVSKPLSGSQIDIIDMEKEPDGMYNFILNYQDVRTQFLVLRPMTTRTPEEVAEILFDIFCLLGIPCSLNYGAEQEYCNKVIHTLLENWHVKVPLSDSQPNNSNQVSQDIFKTLIEWMSTNQTRNWAPNLRIIQSLRNHTFQDTMKCTPHEALFGRIPRNGYAKLNAMEGALSKTTTEENLRHQLALLKHKLDEVNEIIVNNETPLRSRRIKSPAKPKESSNSKSICSKCKSLNNISKNLPTRTSSRKIISKIPKPEQNSRYKKPADKVGNDKVSLSKPLIFNVGDKVMVSMSHETCTPKKRAPKKAKLEPKKAILERLFYRNESPLIGFRSKTVSPLTMVNGARSRSVTSRRGLVF